ncbi:glycosyl hydrolase family 28-related protein [Paenibacillus oceani]|uniref:Rhamnogalacturonase A/B/Epimerase-like pectate lyase domain-containing protein n=1 Tax=Paenibacillus oceani TaxID=2772510 RepID=A0A927GZT5_9BACL|nr:glycosyl hydrolase family 28-related protein [Paenibacillus oceani]MBD2862985.1 hypothetical protein [Paenibacillus oceani]
MENKSNGKSQENQGGARPVSRRTAIAAIGTGTLAAAGAAMLLPKSIAMGQTVAEAVYGGGESCCGTANVTIAQMRTDTAPDLSGGIYYVTDAGREGEFYYDAGDTSSTDDNGTVFVSGSGKRYKRSSGRFPANVYNVRWFGAKGDNTADDSAAFQAAIDKAQEQYEVDKTGGTVYVPPGKYKVTGLTVRKPYVTIKGEGNGSSILMNYSNSAAMFDIQREANVTSSMHSFEMRDLMIKNNVNRLPGDRPLVYARQLVSSRFTNVIFRNSNAFEGGSGYNGSGLKILNGFELTFTNCVFSHFLKGYAVDLPCQSMNVGNYHFLDCLWMYCGHGLLIGRGGSSMHNSTLLSNPKFVGWQGGHYIRDGKVKYAQTTIASSPAANQVTLSNASGFESGQLVLVGSESRLTPAYISAISGSTITLDRDVAVLPGDTALQGTVAVLSGWNVQEVRMNVGHFEGYDVGLLASNHLGLISLDSVHAGNCSNVVVIDDQVQYVSIQNCRVFASDPNNLWPNWWTAVRITKLDSDDNLIILDNNMIEGGGAYVSYVGREVFNQTAFQPKVRIQSRQSGAVYAGRFDHSFSGNVKIGGAWNGPHLIMGTYHLWVDASGALRMKNGVPSGDLDGSPV